MRFESLINELVLIVSFCMLFIIYKYGTASKSKINKKELNPQNNNNKKVKLGANTISDHNRISTISQIRMYNDMSQYRYTRDSKWNSFVDSYLNLKIANENQRWITNFHKFSNRYIEKSIRYVNSKHIFIQKFAVISKFLNEYVFNKLPFYFKPVKIFNYLSKRISLFRAFKYDDKLTKWWYKEREAFATWIRIYKHKRRRYRELMKMKSKTKITLRTTNLKSASILRPFIPSWILVNQYNVSDSGIFKYVNSDGTIPIAERLRIKHYYKRLKKNPIPFFNHSFNSFNKFAKKINLRYFQHYRFYLTMKKYNEYIYSQNKFYIMRILDFFVRSNRKTHAGSRATFFRSHVLAFRLFANKLGLIYLLFKFKYFCMSYILILQVYYKFIIIYGIFFSRPILYSFKTCFMQFVSELLIKLTNFGFWIIILLSNCTSFIIKYITYGYLYLAKSVFGTVFNKLFLYFSYLFFRLVFSKILKIILSTIGYYLNKYMFAIDMTILCFKLHIKKILYSMHIKKIFNLFFIIYYRVFKSIYVIFLQYYIRTNAQINSYSVSNIVKKYKLRYSNKFVKPFFIHEHTFLKILSSYFGYIVIKLYIHIFFLKQISIFMFKRSIFRNFLDKLYAFVSGYLIKLYGYFSKNNAK